METFKTLEKSEEYNKKQIGLLNAKRLKDDPEAKYEEDYFKRITQNSQHHKVFNSDWSNYYTLELADTLLPYADGYKTKGTLVYDGAELFIESPKVTQKVMSLSKDGKLISTAFFTYPKGVKIQQKKNTLQIEHFEIVIFAEVDKDNSIDIYLRFGQDFRQFLNDYFHNKKLATNVSSIENKIYKTTVNDFKENFADGMVHFSQMKFLLNLLDIKYDEVVVEHYFVNSWWTDENDLPIQEALLNDTVKFHIETKEIPDNEIIFITLYDDDRRVNLDEDGKNDKLKLVYSASGKEVIYAKVVKNKVSLTLKLENFESFLKKEPDSSLELFFTCSYVHPKTKESVNKDLPSNIKNYLKVKGMPKIIFVNGHWNKIANKLSMSPGNGGKKYWEFFNANIINYVQDANNYYGIKSSEVIYIDGSSFLGGNENGEERKNRGYKYANDNFELLINGVGNESIFLLSHSEGGAFAAGIAKLLFEKGIKIGESLMLSSDEADEFLIEENYLCYQIVAGYITEDLLTNKKMFNIDPVVLDNRIDGISRYGVFISKDSSFFTVHGATISNDVFIKMEKLKNIRIEKAINSKGKTVYLTNPIDEDWYKIDDNILYNKKIDLYPKQNSILIENYENRED